MPNSDPVYTNQTRTIEMLACHLQEAIAEATRYRTRCEKARAHYIELQVKLPVEIKDNEPSVSSAQLQKLYGILIGVYDNDD